MSRAAILSGDLTVTSLSQRQTIIQLHATGLSYGQIAERVGCSRWTVGRWVRAWKREGAARRESRSHRPRSAKPLGFPTPPTEPHRPLWQVDFKQKGGAPI